MGFIILVLLAFFLVGFFFPILIQRFFQAKIILFIPSLIGISVFIYNILIANPYAMDGLEGLNIVVREIIFTSIILGNVAGLLFIRFNRNKN